MRPLKELTEKGFQIETETAKPHWKVFEDNSRSIEITKVQKLRPWKQLNVKLHHFRSYVGRETLIHKVDTKSQPADLLTKPLNEDLLVKHWSYVTVR